MTDVAYQGAPGSWSEEAAMLLVPGADLLPCRLFQEVFDHLRRDPRARAVVPIENALAGTVHACQDLLARSEATVLAEAVRPISHALVAAPGVGLEDVVEVWSHPVALAQCEELFRAHPRLRPVPVFDTAGALKELLAAGRRDAAAIAARRAAAIYGGSVLREGVEDHPGNATRFLLLGSGTDTPAPDGPGPHRTSLLFTTAHAPGALHRCLAPFAETGLNVTRLESRPLPGRPFHYLFAMEIVEEDRAADVRAAIDLLRPHCGELRLLGRYPVARARA